MGLMREEIARYVASLAIPDERKAVVLAELLDHAASAREAAVREGRDPEVAAREALGDLEAMRRSLEAVEPAFHASRRATFVRGIVGGVAIAFVIDLLQTVALGVPAAIIALAIAALCAPPRVIELLRAELRGKRVKGTLGSGVPVGPAVTYGYTVMSTPFLIWIGMIVVRGFAFGTVHVDVPWCAFAVLAVVYGTLFVEMVRARVTA